MKIGILTFHCAHNYGAMLQAYALQYYLMSQNHTVSIIDYKPIFLLKPYYRFNIHYFLSKDMKKLFLNLISEPYHLFLRNRRWNNFNAFARKYFHTNSLLESDYDYIFYGSDQIWNPLITGGKYDKYYWGNVFNCKKIAYAASAGAYNFQLKDRLEVSDLLNNFNAISVRESSLQLQLSQFTDKKITQVVDPVFLLNASQWKHLCQRRRTRKPFLLCYNLNNSIECDNLANYIAQKLSLKRIDLVANISKKLKCTGVKQCASPEEFVSLFSEASYVVTSSFHGTAFSILFQKTFYTVGMGIKKGRVISLLNALNLDERYLEKSIVDINNDIDWDIVNVAKEKYINLSKDFINKNIM